MPNSFIHWRSALDSTRADIAIVIVSYQVKDLLQKNIETLLKSVGTISAELIVIDNASQDGTADMMCAHFSQVQFVANAENMGFAAAVNQGLALRHARHCLLLNPDMLVEADALQKTVEYLNIHPDVAVMGGQLLTSDGKINPSVRRFPDVWSQLYILLKLPYLFPKCVNHYLWTDFDYQTEQSVDSVRGSYFAISEKALLDLGGLDPRYFIWFEEVDYCKNAVSKGWKVMYVPSVQALDYVGKSFHQVTRFWAQQQFTRSMLTYFKKWHSPSEVWLIRCGRVFGLIVNWCVDRVRSLKGSPGIRPT